MPQRAIWIGSTTRTGSSLLRTVVQAADQAGPGPSQICQERRIVATDSRDQSFLDAGGLNKGLRGIWHPFWELGLTPTALGLEKQGRQKDRSLSEQPTNGTLNDGLPPLSPGGNAAVGIKA